ncbi:MAG: hypothetical protein QM725_06390 [Lacibacter sp.]
MSGHKARRTVRRLTNTKSKFKSSGSGKQVIYKSKLSVFIDSVEDFLIEFLLAYLCILIYVIFLSTLVEKNWDKIEPHYAVVGVLFLTVSSGRKIWKNVQKKYLSQFNKH